MAAPVLTSAWKVHDPHPVQHALWHCQKRFVAIRAGRGSGKTTIGLRRLVRFLPVIRGAWAVHRYAYLGPTREQAKKVAWEELKALVPPSWLEGRPSESHLIIKTAILYATGWHRAELHVIGMDKPARFEGKQWDGVFEDEASDQKPKVHLSIRPALAERIGWWWKGGVPKRHGAGAKVFKKFCERGERGDTNYATFSWSSESVLSEDEIAQAQEDLDDKDYNEQYKGNWESASGAAFHAFDSKIHVRDERHPLGAIVYNPSRPIYVGSDFNVNPMAWCLCQKTPDGSGLEVFDEIWLTNTNTQATLDFLWAKYEFHKGGWFFHGDQAARQRKTSASSSDYAQIRDDKRFNGRVLYPKAQPEVKDRLSSCNALLRNKAGTVRCWIHPQCEHLIDDLEHRSLDDKGYPTDAGKSGTMEGHMTDAFGYLIHWYWPITRREHTTAPKIGVFTGEGQ